MFIRSINGNKGKLLPYLYQKSNTNKNIFLSLNNIIIRNQSTNNKNNKKPKIDLSKINTWEDLNKLDSLDGIPAEKLERILKQKTLEIKYAMNPDKPLKTETELELEYVKQLKQKEQEHRSAEWTNFKKEYGWSSVNWILYIFIGYYIAKSISLEMNYHINEGILKERLAEKVEEFEKFKSEHQVKNADVAIEDNSGKRRKWFFGIW
ncbi:hypothetical protein HANVADRAFT_52496 [Hanseniaspora valbyensis NRRL Y-1626]|uniref:Uncharacterized protein n=1 Tax=Hanseniaspora valbyensis NRRL Y-1626 TaxID=766949 RepID=A0A1B7TEN7_9ASCO|nr:hypothetical protein HANVADRAFT_52496 [Hanseniaspora valbyensis NRRL Y-1626]